MIYTLSKIILMVYWAPLTNFFPSTHLIYSRKLLHYNTNVEDKELNVIILTYVQTNIGLKLMEEASRKEKKVWEWYNRHIRRRGGEGNIDEWGIITLLFSVQ